MTARPDQDRSPVTRPDRDVTRAIQEARVAQSMQSEVISDLRAGELARLQHLADDIAALLGQVPAEHRHLFDGGFVPGYPPRVWVDVLTYVEMGRDKRLFRLIRDTRDGQVVLRESVTAAEIVERVIEYVAHRVVERERALAVDTGAGLGGTGVKRLGPREEKVPTVAPVQSDSEAPAWAAPAHAGPSGWRRHAVHYGVGFLSALMSALLITAVLAAGLVTLGILRQ